MSKSVLAALTLFAASALAADFKAAYVDMQRAVQETDDGKAAMLRLKALKESKERQVEKDRNALQAEVEAFQKQAQTMEEKARMAKEQDLQKKYVELAQRAERAGNEMAEQQNKELNNVVPKLRQLLGLIAQREGLTMVFDTGVAWAPPSLDLTNELIRMYNAQYKGAKSDAPKAVDPKK